MITQKNSWLLKALFYIMIALVIITFILVKVANLSIFSNGLILTIFYSTFILVFIFGFLFFIKPELIFLIYFPKRKNVEATPYWGYRVGGILFMIIAIMAIFGSQLRLK